MTTPKPAPPAALDLSGLNTRPAQVWGAVRLVPLVPDEPCVDLRLNRRIYEDEVGVVRVGPRTQYVSYVPHGFVADWTEDGTAAAAYGTQLGRGSGSGSGSSSGPGRAPAPVDCMPLRFHHRMVRREDRTRLRFLPLHLALEGYLSLHFGGPTVAWEEWSQKALRNGLSPRVEEAYTGAEVTGLADALRVFEIHPNQCGVLVYVADALAAAFVVPHPDDYRALHPTLVLDMFGDLIHHYSTVASSVPELRVALPDTEIDSLAALRAAADRAEAQWAEFHDAAMVTGLLDASYNWQTMYTMGRFALARFRPPFRPKEENHIGEAITDETGRVVYLKTFRLSENQVRRGHLLERLAAHGWRLPDTASELGITPAELGMRLDAAGFGALLRQDVLDMYRKRARGGGGGRRDTRGG